MHITILPNHTKAKTADTLDKLCTFLDDRKVPYHISDLDTPIEHDTDVLLYLGGDGTFIRSAKIAYRYDLPIAGINTGNYGYHTNSSIEDMEGWLDKLLDTKLKWDECPILMTDDLIVNDIVLNSVGSFSSFKVYHDERLIYEADASGLIVATGIGSTGINLSTRGPVIPIDSDDVILTPISPLRGEGYSFVFPLFDHIDIESVVPFAVDVDGERHKEELEKLQITRPDKKIKRLI